MRAVVAIVAAVLLSVAVGAPQSVALPSQTGASDVARTAEHAPEVGECFDLDDLSLRTGGWWTDQSPVSCTQPHTFQVTETGLLPADVNAFAFAAGQCGALDVWTEVGVNVPEAGVVAAPVRVQPRSFAVRQPVASYVCGAVAVTLDGVRPPSAIPLTTTIELLTDRERADLRYCGSASRPARAPQVTVPCSSRPRWEVTAWVLWTAFYDGDPGRAALKARASALCGPDTVASVPAPGTWSSGVPRTWCYTLVP